jgi:hypothetical protein
MASTLARLGRSAASPEADGNPDQALSAPDPDALSIVD